MGVVSTISPIASAPALTAAARSSGVHGVGETLPVASTATPSGELRPVNGSTVWLVDPAASFTTLPMSGSPSVMQVM